MNKEQLRMQMLAGIITEGQYHKLTENDGTSNLVEWIEFDKTIETDTDQRYSSSTKFALKLKDDSTIYTGTFYYGSLSDKIEWETRPNRPEINDNELDEYVNDSWFDHRWE